MCVPVLQHKEYAMKSIIKNLFVMSMFVAVTSCRSNMESASRFKFRPADPNAKNIALIVGSPNDLKGVAKDVNEVSKLIKESDFGYEVTVIPAATVNDIMTKANELGQTLSENSTVLFYFSGHGSEQGYLFAQGFQQFKLSSVAKNFGTGFAKGKFRRFIAIMDSCFSGQNVNGDQAMFLNQSKPLSVPEILSASIGNMTSDMKPKADPNLPFEQALVLSAAQRDQTSLDMGPSIGGAFTSAFRKVLKKDLASPGSLTLSQVLEEAKKETMRSTGNHHAPAWKAMPETMLNEPLTQPSQNADGVFVALGETQSPLIFASLPTSVAVSAVELCKGEKIACSSGSASKVLSFVKATDINVAGRDFFRSENGYTVASGDVLTVVVKGSNGNVLSAQAVKITNK
jgi:hypothetical protein